MNSNDHIHSHANRCRRRRRSFGLSLVELMIAMTLGLVVIGGLTQLYLGSRDANRIVENTTYLNDNGRFAVEFLARELRLAGYFSCGGNHAQIANALDVANSYWWGSLLWLRLNSGQLLPTGIEGWDGGVSGTDAFVVRYADTRNLLRVNPGDFDASNRRFTFDHAHDLSPGDLVVLNNANCDQTVLFQVARAEDSGDSHYIEYNKDNNTLRPGICTDDLAGHYSCDDISSAEPVSDTLFDDAVIGELVARYFYVTNDPGNCGDVAASCSLLAQCPTLFAVEAGATYSDPISFLPILRNVTDLQVEYGRDEDIRIGDWKVDSAGDGVDGYYTASEISGDEWLQVVSLRITITMVSKVCKTEQFVTTVAVRNAGIVVGAY